ncbi:Rid family hydrolase [Nonomuraea sp. NPDC001636]|uniref:Rid family hydrolase n=1 Tax=Nonomuraea sp. NPDC001636 TaxID=3154391 RepID=UPI00332F0831
MGPGDRAVRARGDREVARRAVPCSRTLFRRQEDTIINPETLHDPVGYGSSDIACASGETVFVARECASDREGHVVSEGFAEQARPSFANLGNAPAAADLDHSHVVQIRTHIVDQDQDRLEVLLKAVHDVWGDLPPAQTLMGWPRSPCPTCCSNWTPSRPQTRPSERALPAFNVRSPSARRPREHGVPVFVHAAERRPRPYLTKAQGHGRACASWSRRSASSRRATRPRPPSRPPPPASWDASSGP